MAIHVALNEDDIGTTIPTGYLLEASIAMALVEISRDDPKRIENPDHNDFTCTGMSASSDAKPRAQRFSTLIPTRFRRV